MTIAALVWISVFLPLVVVIMISNARAVAIGDHDDVWPPGCVVLFALWPVLLGALVVGEIVLWFFPSPPPAKRAGR